MIFLSKIIIKYFFIFLVAVNSSAKVIENSAIKPDQYITAECSVFDKNGNLVKKFGGGLCAFLPNGNIVKAMAEELTYYDKSLRVIWTKPMHGHHQVTLTEDFKKVLILDSDAHLLLGCHVRFDNFMVIDLKTGDVEAKLDLYQLIKQLLPISRNKTPFHKNKWNGPYRNTLCELTHSNSFQQITTNAKSRWHPAWSPGNFLIGAQGLGLFLIMDSKLKKILWTKGFSAEPSGFHDLQILKNGHFLFYQNKEVQSNGAIVSSLVEVEPISEKVIWKQNIILDGEQVFTKIQGGLQRLANGHHLFSVTTKKNGTEIVETDKNAKVVLRFTPFPDNATGFGQAMQQPRVLRLKSFLQNNQWNY